MFDIILDVELQDAIDSGIKNCTDKWGKAYLIAVKDILEDYGQQALEDQLIYARSNMQGWRGEEAQRVKTILSKYIKIYHNEKVEKRKARKEKQDARRTAQEAI